MSVSEQSVPRYPLTNVHCKHLLVYILSRYSNLSTCDGRVIREPCAQTERNGMVLAQTLVDFLHVVIGGNLTYNLYPRSRNPGIPARDPLARSLSRRPSAVSLLSERTLNSPEMD